jgi:hypothetical protein
MAPLNISSFISFSNTATMYPASFLPVSIVLLSNTGKPPKNMLLLRQGIGTLVEVLEGEIEGKKGRLCLLQLQACSVSPVYIPDLDDADPPR